MDTVITTANTTSSMQPGDSIPVTGQQGQVDLVKIARQAGVGRFVLVSIPLNMEDCPFTTAQRTVEEAVMKSGMDYTILCPTIFMEDWLSPAMGFDYANARATIYGGGHAGNQYISMGDVAQYVVECLDNSAARNQVIEVGQPQATSMLEAVRIFEKSAGKSFELEFIPEATLVAQREASTDPMQVSFATFMLNMAHGIRVDNALAERLFSFPLASVEDYARRMLG